MGKVFKCGLFIGRFQTFHNGHKMVVDAMRNCCEQSVVIVGSAQEFGTKKNPFDDLTRMEMIQRTYAGCSDVKVFAINDRTEIADDQAWGDYLLEQFAHLVGGKPDLIVNGAEDCRKSWFNPDHITGISQLVLSRETLTVSASECRKLMLENKGVEWADLTPKEIHPMYEKLREQLLAAK